MNEPVARRSGIPAAYDPSGAVRPAWFEEGGLPSFSPPGEGTEDGVRLLERLLDVLALLDPASAVLARSGLPRRDSTFGLGLAFFLAATAGGVRDWIGGDVAAAIDALDDGALLGDMQAALLPSHRRTGDGMEWQVLTVPVLHGNRLDRLLCALGVDEEIAVGCRVALQVRLPALGPVQLVATQCGLRLDMTLSTSDGLPAPLQAELHENFSAALADAGMRGALTVGPLLDAWLDLDAALGADASV